jgi:ribosomal protein S18 acetylase RimI-like enzyme
MSSMTPAQARLTSAAEVLPFRECHREEMNCQIVHDSIHRRTGWTTTYLLELAGEPAGFGSIAIGGPWTGKPTIFEFYVAPPHRARAFDLFEAFQSASGARHMEIQSNDALLAVMLHTYAKDIESEKIVFHYKLTTDLPSHGATLRCTTPSADINQSIDQRQGGPEWVLEVNGQEAGKGGILFHYNHPYGDIYMEVNEPFRRRGLGSYLVQELKRAAYEMGAVPCARCSPSNVASRRTLQKSGFVPFAHILLGVIPPG